MGRIEGGSGVAEGLEGYGGLMGRVRGMVLAGHCSGIEDLVDAEGHIAPRGQHDPQQRQLSAHTRGLGTRPLSIQNRPSDDQPWEGVVRFSRAGAVDWEETLAAITQSPSWSLAAAVHSPLVPAVMGALRSVAAGRGLPAREAASVACQCLATVLARDPVSLPDAAELVVLACAALGDPLIAAQALRLMSLLALDHSRVEQCFPEEAVSDIVAAAAAHRDAALGVLAALAVGGQATGLLVRFEAHEVARRVKPATADSLAVLLGLCAHLATAAIPTSALMDAAALLCEGAAAYAVEALGDATPAELRDDALLVILAGGVVGGPVLAGAMEAVFGLGQEEGDANDCSPLVVLVATHLVAGCRPSGRNARALFAERVAAAAGFRVFARRVVSQVASPSPVARRCALGFVSHLSTLCPGPLWGLQVVVPLCESLVSCALPPLSDSRSAVLAARALARIVPEATGAELTRMLSTCVLALKGGPPPRAVTAMMHLLAELLPRAPPGEAINSDLAWVAEAAARVLVEGSRAAVVAPGTPLQAAATSAVGSVAFLWGGDAEEGEWPADGARPYGQLRCVLASSLIAAVAAAQAQDRPAVPVSALAAQTHALVAVIRGLASPELSAFLAGSELLLTVSAQLQHGTAHAQPALALLVAFQRHHGTPDVIPQIARLNLYDWASQALLTSPNSSTICKLSLALLGHALDLAGTPTGIIPAGLRSQLFHRSVELITAGGKKSSRRRGGVEDPDEETEDDAEDDEEDDEKEEGASKGGDGQQHRQGLERAARPLSRLLPQQWAPAMRVAEALLPDRGSLGELVPGLVGALGLRKSEEEVRWSMNLLWRLVGRDEDAVRLDMDRAGVPAVLMDPSQEDRAKALGALGHLCCAGSQLPGARRIRAWVFGADRPSDLLALVADQAVAVDVRAAAARLLVAALEDEPEHVRGSYDHDIVEHLAGVLGGPPLPAELALPVLRIAALALADSDNVVEACVGPLAQNLLTVLGDLQARLGEEALRAGLAVISMVIAAGAAGPPAHHLALRSFCRGKMLQAGAMDALCALFAHGPSNALALVVLELVLKLVAEGLAHAGDPSSSLALSRLLSPAAVAGLTVAITPELAGAAMSPADLVLSLPLLDPSCEPLLGAFLKAGGAECLSRVVIGCPLDHPVGGAMHARMLAAVRLLVGLVQSCRIDRGWLSSRGSLLATVISLIDKIASFQQEQQEPEAGGGLGRHVQHTAPHTELHLPPPLFSLSLSSRSRSRALSSHHEGKVSPSGSQSSEREKARDKEAAAEKERMPITTALSQPFHLPTSHTLEALNESEAAAAAFAEFGSSLPRGAAVSFLRGVPSTGSVGRLSTGRASVGSGGKAEAAVLARPASDLTPADDMYAVLTLSGLFLLGGAPMSATARAGLLAASVQASEAFPFMSVCKAVLGIITGICGASERDADLPCPRGLARFFHICLRARDELPKATIAAIAANIASLPRMCTSEAEDGPLCDLAAEFCTIFSTSLGPGLDERSACLEALMALADSPATRRHVTSLGLRELISQSLKAVSRADQESKASKAYQALGLETLQVISQRKLQIGSTLAHPEEAALLAAADPLSLSLTLDDEDQSQTHLDAPEDQPPLSASTTATTAASAVALTLAATTAKNMLLPAEVKRARGLTVAHYSRDKSRAITIKSKTDFSEFFAE
jgi:hypothetical protein